MKTIKIIDLLNKIANGEEVPKKIYCFNREFYLKENTYFGDNFTLMDYIQEEDLNDKVEILEEKKIPEIIPEALFEEYTNGAQVYQLYKTLREIIDYLDYLKSKGE